MAAIDSLLKLMAEQGAHGLIIASDQVPSLEKGEEVVHLSMPAMPAELVTSFARELARAELGDDPAPGRSLEGTYRSADGLTLVYEIATDTAGVRLKIRSAGEPPASVESNHSDTAGLPAPVQSAIPTQARRTAAPSSARSPQPEVDLDLPPVAPGRQIDGLLLSVIGSAVEQGASDIFFTSGDHPRIRTDGEMEVIRSLVTDQEAILGLAGGSFSADRRQALRSHGSVDLALVMEISGQPHRFRMNLFHHHRGVAAALRPIRRQPPSFEELNLPADLRELCAWPHGLVLLTGAAGSGKSSTLAALIEHINQTESRHIITLEDPIEFEYENRQSLVHQREVGQHVESFSSGLRSALRESPDVILVGEMRDLPTIAAALTAAETGHLVLSTLHTGDATSAVDRIIDIFPGEQQPQARLQLAAALRAVIAQILIPSSRYGGRVPAIEKLICTYAVAHHIREGRNHQIPSAIQSGAAEGMITLERSLASLVRKGRISLSTALKHTRDEDGLRKLLGPTHR